MRLGRIGLDRVAGFLEGGMRGLDARPDLVERVERVTAPALAEQLASLQPPLVVDVRSEREWQEKRIEGSTNIPLSRLQERLDELPRDRPLAVLCASGYRAAIALSVLQLAGFDRVSDLVGGLGAWESSKLATAA